MIKIKYFFILFIFLISSSSGQEHNKVGVDYWKCHMIDNSVIDSVQLKERYGFMLIIVDKDSTYGLKLYSITHISRYVESKGIGNEILGVLGGAFIGGLMTGLVLPRSESKEEYMTAAIIVGGLMGYFISKSNSEEKYQLAGLERDKLFTLIDSLVEKNKINNK